MTKELADQEEAFYGRIAEEKKIREKVDKEDNRWNSLLWWWPRFRNWLSQFVELKGEENVKAEEADSRGFQCYEESGEKMYRIWSRMRMWDREKSRCDVGMTCCLSEITVNGGW